MAAPPTSEQEALIERAKKTAAAAIERPTTEEKRERRAAREAELGVAQTAGNLAFPDKRYGVNDAAANAVQGEICHKPLVILHHWNLHQDKMIARRSANDAAGPQSCGAHACHPLVSDGNVRSWTGATIE